MLQPGDEIDIWVIEHQLGSGGMGSVYRCHNRNARRILAAIKVLEGAIARHPEAQARFIREAEILFTIDHPNIVKVRNVRIDGVSPYIEMQFVEGRSLEDALGADGGIDLAIAVPLMLQIAEALDYLHKQGIRHRDMKPANLLITQDGSIKLVDFGLAMEANATRLTQGNASFGTVSYAPPEWVDPANLDPVQWDLYGMGVVFWEMLTGAVAFPVSGAGSARQQAMQVILNKQNHAPLDPGPAYPMALRELIGLLTRSEPSERMRQASDAVERLQAIAAHPLPESRPLRSLRTLTPAAQPRKPDPTIVPRDPGQTFALDDVQSPASTLPESIRGLSPLPPPSPLHHADTLLDAAIEVRPRRGGGLKITVAVLLLIGTMSVLAAGLAAVIITMWPAPPTILRDASVILQGVADGTPVSLALDGRSIETADGLTRPLPQLELGKHSLRWAVGAGCEAATCETACPDWCLTGTSTLTIAPGEGPQSISLQVATPAPRSIRIGASPMADDVAVSIVIHDLDGGMDELVYRAKAVQPGQYDVTITAGQCEASQAPCEAECPDGCRKVRRTLTVPVGQGRFESVLPVKHPTRVKVIRAPTPPPIDVDRDTETKAPPPAVGPRQLVTNAQFARWLTSHPKWTRAEAIQAKTVDNNYLQGWTGDQPPTGSANHPVVSVSYLAALAYCQGRGLPKLTDPPQAWNEAEVGLAFEFRSANASRAPVIESTGSSSKVEFNQAFIGTGFRCAR